MRQRTRLKELESKLTPPDTLKVVIVEDGQSLPTQQRGVLVVKLADVSALEVNYCDGKR
jgi:hypothetical protein